MSVSDFENELQHEGNTAAEGQQKELAYLPSSRGKSREGR